MPPKRSHDDVDVDDEGDEEAEVKTIRFVNSNSEKGGKVYDLRGICLRLCWNYVWVNKNISYIQFTICHLIFPGFDTYLYICMLKTPDPYISLKLDQFVRSKP